MQDVYAAIQGGHPGIELIDIIFALSNVKLVRGLVQDQVRQLEEISGVSKGQNEGMRGMIVAKQKSLLSNLLEVEKMLEGIVSANNTIGARTAGMSDVQLNAEQSRAMVSAIVFAINHMAKFVPGSGMSGSGLPESII